MPRACSALIASRIELRPTPMSSIRLSSVGMGAPGGRPRSTIRSMIRLVISSLRCGRATTGSPDSALVGTPTRRTSYVAPAEAVSCESWAMGFVIQIVSGKAEARAVVLDVPGRADNAARDDLGAKTALRGLQDTAYARRHAHRRRIPARAARRRPGYHRA